MDDSEVSSIIQNAVMQEYSNSPKAWKKQTVKFKDVKHLCYIANNDIRWAHMATYGFIRFIEAYICMKNFSEENHEGFRAWVSSIGKELNLCSLECGPSTECIGFLHFITKTQKKVFDKKIQCTTVDCNYDWKAAVEYTTNTYIKKLNAENKHRFIHSDLHGYLDDQVKESIKSADVVLLSRFYSSTYPELKTFRRVLESVFQNMKTGGIAVYIENSRDARIEMVEEIANDNLMIAVYGPRSNVQIPLKNYPKFQILDKNHKIKYSASKEHEVDMGIWKKTEKDLISFVDVVDVEGLNFDLKNIECPCGREVKLSFKAEIIRKKAVEIQNKTHGTENSKDEPNHEEKKITKDIMELNNQENEEASEATKSKPENEEVREGKQSKSENEERCERNEDQSNETNVNTSHAKTTSDLGCSNEENSKSVKEDYKIVCATTNQSFIVSAEELERVLKQLNIKTEKE